MTEDTFRASLGALRNAGSVCGVVLARGHDLLFRDSPYPESKLVEMAGTLDDIVYYFEQERRAPDLLAFGYDVGQLLILLSGEFRLVVFYGLAEEIDFVARAARSFLKDFVMGQVARASHAR